MAQDDKKTLILHAAQQLFQKVGLDAVTMEDVAQSMGMGKSTLYYYFKSKEQIFTSVMEMEMDEILLSTIKQMSKQSGLRAKLEVFATVKFEMIRKRKSMYSTVESGMDAETFSRYIGFKKEVHRKYIQKEKLLIQQLLIDGGRDCQIRELNDGELERMAYVFLLSVRGINREYIVHGNSDEAYNTLPAFCELFVNGLK